MNAYVANVGYVQGNSKAIARSSRATKVNVEIGTGAIAPKVAIQRANSSRPN